MEEQSNRKKKIKKSLYEGTNKGTNELELRKQYL